MITWDNDKKEERYRSSLFTDNNGDNWELVVSAGRMPATDDDGNDIDGIWFDTHSWRIEMEPVIYQDDDCRDTITLAEEGRSGVPAFYGTVAQAKQWAVKQMRAWVRTQRSQGS